MKYFYDCKFVEVGRTVDLISIGIVAADGREYYAVALEAPWELVLRHPWLMRNVVQHLPGSGVATPIGYSETATDIPAGEKWFWQPDVTSVLVKPRQSIANEAREFFGFDPPEDVELWSWHGAYEHGALSKLWVPGNRPEGLPDWTNNLKQEHVRQGSPELPTREPGEHNALADARYNMAIAKALGVIP
jgi:hypothetical protein